MWRPWFGDIWQAWTWQLACPHGAGSPHDITDRVGSTPASRWRPASLRLRAQVLEANPGCQVRQPRRAQAPDGRQERAGPLCPAHRETRAGELVDVEVNVAPVDIFTPGH